MLQSPRQPCLREVRAGVEVEPPLQHRKDEADAARRAAPGGQTVLVLRLQQGLEKRLQDVLEDVEKTGPGCDFRAVQRSALCRSRRELSNAYLLAKFGFDTAENEPFFATNVMIGFQSRTTSAS